MALGLAVCMSIVGVGSTLLTICLRRTVNAGHFQFKSGIVFTVVWLGAVVALSAT